MKIKKLTVNGFKSFMDKLDINFPMGISAVVGPNGCGKSNIVDAIRWAMGEQSAKQLRGRNMEDVIFNGAGDLKPMGMAEVTIVLENGDGSFPQEYINEEELAITRRLYRSGESEYLINSVPCRLKDVHEIFMDTGLGNRAYSIIGQGRIGSIVEQRPEETRIMLEEAAGITKYKKKEAESQRKLELTKRNLNRVEDILVEVQNRMRSLKRQAAKARRYKALGEEIQRLELILNSNSYQDLSESHGKKSRSTDELLEKEVILTTQLSGIQAKIESMNADLDGKDYRVSTLRKKYLNLREDFNKKEAALETIAGEQRLQKEMEDRLGHEKDDITRRIRMLEDEKIGLKQTVAKLSHDSIELETEISVIDDRLKTRKQLFNEAKEEYERARNRVNSDMSKEIGLNKESGYINQRIEEITSSRTRLEREKSDIDQKIETLMESSRKKDETRNALSQKLEDIEKDILTVKQECEEQERIRKNIEVDLKNAEAEFNIAQTRLSSLRSLTDNFEGYKLGVRTIMKATDLKARNEGRVLGLVADIIQVPPQYELAVETVLSDRLQYIIVEDQEDAKESIEYLKARSKGRSSFISLRDLNDKPSGFQGNGSPLLRDLVTVPDQYKRLVDLLLGDTTLAESLDQAISSWRNNGKDHSFVTHEGDILDKSGIMSGGKLSEGSRGLLTRKREIKDLEAKVAGYSKKLLEHRARLEEIELQIEDKKISLNALEQERLDCNNKLNELDKVIFLISHELDQLDKLSEKISTDLEKSSNEYVKHTEALNRIASEIKECEMKKKKEEEYLSRKETELRESEDEFEQIRNELEKLRMKYNRYQEEEKGIIREIERIEDFIQEAQERLVTIEQDILKSREKQEDYILKENSVRESIKSFYSTLEEAEESVNIAEQDRNNFYAEIKQEEKKGETLREEMDLLKEKITNARMEHSEIGFKINSLVEKVKDRFNLDLRDIYKNYLEEDFSEIDTRDKLDHQKTLRERLGDVNLTAIQEHEALKERHDFIQSQREDLLKSIDSIIHAIRRINKTCLDKFMETFNEADQKIKQVFPILFNGGTASLKLTDEGNPLESGVLVEVRPPGKKLSHMGLLSGGEKALVAMSLLFAIYLIKPSPFCLLDEVDAPLDEANIDRFNNLLCEIKKYSQILMVTHNRRTMEIVDSLYGVTMEKAGVSKMVAVNLNGNRMN